MALEDYKKAQKAGQKSYHTNLSQGKYAYLPSLADMLPQGEVYKEVSLGLVQIPMELIAGTYTAARQNAFAPNFMPLLEAETEFATKWIALCDAHLEEGIHDSIVAFEYMNHFYVQEGNKRVSVLKYFEAVNIPGTVVRIMPKQTDEKDNKIYYEFVEFYEHSQINYVLFSQTGRYEKLTQLLGMEPEHDWTDEEKEIFYSVFYRFKNVFESKGGDKLPITVGDALLTYIEVYGYSEIVDKLPAQIREDITRVWSEFVIMKEEKPVEHVLEPVKEEPKNLISKILPITPKKLKIAFVNDKNPKTSSWTYAHELGRLHLDEAFNGQVETCVYNDALAEGKPLEVIEDAIASGCNVIFTTTIQLAAASLKAAAEHPEVKILNCSLNFSHSMIKTYYARLYEAKLLTGIVAGALADDNIIGYVADYPIVGMAANINAFALGASMSNPRARIKLKWSTIEGCDPVEELRAEGVHVVSGLDLLAPGNGKREFGLFTLDENGLTNVAMSVTDWGKLYERLVRNIISGGQAAADPQDAKKSLNYWWGLDAGVVDVVSSLKLGIGTRKLLNMVRNNIGNGTFSIFEGELYAQGGEIVNTEGRLTPEEIVSMNWLAENVDGRIPTAEELKEYARPVVELQGMEIK